MEWNISRKKFCGKSSNRMIFFLHVKILFTTCSLISFGASTIEIRGMIQLYFKIKDYSNKKYFTSQIVKINLTSMYIYIQDVLIHRFESTFFERNTEGRNKELFVIFREEGTRGKGKSTRDLLPGAIGKIWRGSGENGIRGRLPYRVINIFWSRSCFDV